MDFGKFVSLVVTSSLWFSKASEFHDDPFEFCKVKYREIGNLIGAALDYSGLPCFWADWVVGGCRLMPGSVEPIMAPLPNISSGVVQT